VVVTVDEAPWLFSAKEFNACRAELEGISKWQYSGESEVVLLVARKVDGQTAILDLSTAVACNLDEMARDGAFTSVGAFFEQVCRFGEQYKGKDPIWDLSDKMGLRVGKNFLQEMLLTLVPESTRRAYKEAKHYAIRDISR
jgi:hypothetical protein